MASIISQSGCLIRGAIGCAALVMAIVFVAVVVVVGSSVAE